MSAQAYLDALAELVGRFAGIQIPPEKRWYLEGRVRVRMQRVEVAELRDYVALVRGDAGRAELGQLVEALRVGETRFFRHSAQVTALKRVVIPDIEARRVASGQRLIRVWSAGCATGEEPFTVAMLLDDALPYASGFSHDVLATDISDEALAIARAGRFEAAALRTVPALLRSRYFEPDGNAFRASHQLRDMVRFEKRNLQDRIYPRGFDLVLCRNVLIYFDRAGRDLVIPRLADSLLPGGYLFLGYSETLRGFEDRFDVMRTDAGTLYRRGGTCANAQGMTTPSPPANFSHSAASNLQPPARPSLLSGSIRPATAEPPALEAARPTPKGLAEPHVVVLRGRFGDDAQSALSALLQPALSSTSRVVVLDLEQAELLSDGAARVIGRARRLLETEGRVIVLQCRRSGVLRWIRRHELDGGLPIASSLEDALRIAATQGTTS